MSLDCCVALPRGAMGCLQFVIVVFPDHTHLLFLGFVIGYKAFVVLNSTEHEISTACKG